MDDHAPLASVSPEVANALAIFTLECLLSTAAENERPRELEYLGHTVSREEFVRTFRPEDGPFSVSWAAALFRVEAARAGGPVSLEWRLARTAVDTRQFLLAEDLPPNTTFGAGGGAALLREDQFVLWQCLFAGVSTRWNVEREREESLAYTVLVEALELAPSPTSMALLGAAGEPSDGAGLGDTDRLAAGPPAPILLGLAEQSLEADAVLSASDQEHPVPVLVLSQGANDPWPFVAALSVAELAVRLSDAWIHEPVPIRAHSRTLTSVGLSYAPVRTRDLQSRYPVLTRQAHSFASFLRGLADSRGYRLGVGSLGSVTVVGYARELTAILDLDPSRPGPPPSEDRAAKS